MLIIGVGNDFRSDDAVGLLVARAVRDMNLPNVAVVESTGEGTSLMHSFGEAAQVILIDAVYSNADPGTIHRFAAHQHPLPTQYFSRSTHAFSVAEAIELARELQCLPAFLVVIGIEGEAFGFGDGLSPALDEALPRTIEQIVTWIRELVDDESSTVSPSTEYRSTEYRTTNSIGESL